MKELKTFVVVHPLDDVPEMKLDVDALGKMELTRGARTMLYALQGYLAVMLVLVVMHVFSIASHIR